MFNKVKAVGLAAAMMVAPLAASAATVVAPGGSYDLLADAYTFDGNFNIGTPGNSYTFSFTNTAASAAALTIVGVDVRQVTAAFTDGVKLMAGPLSFLFDEDETGGDEGTFKVAAGETIDLVLSFGKVVDAGIMNGKGQAQVGFDIEAAVVPAPAAGLLLLTAIGGLGLARRRKVAAV